MNKYILIDISVFLNKAVHEYARQKKAQTEGTMSNELWVPMPTYTFFKMLLSSLKRIGIDKNTKIIAIEDARNSWRKSFLQKYKEGRTEVKEAMKEVNWLDEYEKFNQFNAQLNNSTDWYFIRISDFINQKELSETEEGKRFGIEGDQFILHGLEFDDICARFCNKFQGNEIYILSIDGDMDQLVYYKGVKVYNPSYKFSNKRGFLKIIEDPLANLAEKIRLGDKSDKITGEHSTELKELLMNLLKLPKFVTDPIDPVLDNLFTERKEINYELLPFPNSLGKKENYDKIYCTNPSLEEESLHRHEVMLKRKEKKRIERNEEARIKRKQKKEESFR